MQTDEVIYEMYRTVMCEMQALIRELDAGKKQRITLDSLHDLTEKVRGVPARVSHHHSPVI